MSAGEPIIAASRPEDGGLAVGLFCWSLVQIGVLAIAAGDLPLVLAQGQPTERSALMLLVAVHFSIGAIFAEPLLGSASRAVVNIALAWPMLQLAGLLAGAPQSHVLAASGAVTLWLTGLACWMGALAEHRRESERECGRRRGRAGPVVSALAGAWTLGGAALAYCHADFGSRPGESVFPMDAWVSPLLGAMQVSTNPWLWSAWGVLAADCAIASAALAITIAYRRRRAARAAAGFTDPQP